MSKYEIVLSILKNVCISDYFHTDMELACNELPNVYFLESETMSGKKLTIRSAWLSPNLALTYSLFLNEFSEMTHQNASFRE